MTKKKATGKQPVYHLDLDTPEDQSAGVLPRGVKKQADGKYTYELSSLEQHYLKIAQEQLANTADSLQEPFARLSQQLKVMPVLPSATFDFSAQILSSLQPIVDQLPTIHNQLSTKMLQAMPSMQQLSSHLIASLAPLNDARIYADIIATEFARPQQLLQNMQIDLSSLFGSLQISASSLLRLEDLNVLSIDQSLRLESTGLQIHSNELVTQERGFELGLVFKMNVQQKAILSKIDESDSRLENIEKAMLQLIAEKQQLFTIRDVDYTPDTFRLKIGDSIVVISPKRERQLCELLLSTREAMGKRWTISDMLQLIDEYDAVSAFDYGKWVQKYYMAARRLNEKLLPILRIELITVDKPSEALFVNPQFYHKP